MTMQTPAGWYPDPTPNARPGTTRFWNGTAWTDHTQAPPSPFEPPAPAYLDPLAPLAPPPPTYGAYGYPVTPFVPKTNSMAIAALVCVLAGFSCGLTVPVGVVLGHVARRQIKTSQGRETGDGLALAALIIGYLAIVAGIMMLFFIMAAMTGSIQ